MTPPKIWQQITTYLTPVTRSKYRKEKKLAIGQFTVLVSIISAYLTIIFFLAKWDKSSKYRKLMFQIIFTSFNVVCPTYKITGGKSAQTNFWKHFAAKYLSANLSSHCLRTTTNTKFRKCWILGNKSLFQKTSFWHRFRNIGQIFGSR